MCLNFGIVILFLFRLLERALDFVAKRGHVSISRRRSDSGARVRVQGTRDEELSFQNEEDEDEDKATHELHFLLYASITQLNSNCRHMRNEAALTGVRVQRQRAER